MSSQLRNFSCYASLTPHPEILTKCAMFLCLIHAYGYCTVLSVSKCLQEIDFIFNTLSS